MDEKGKVFGKISIIDIFIILVIIGAAVILGFKFLKPYGNAYLSGEKTYVVKVAAIKQEAAAQLQPGDRLINGDKVEMGEITEVKTEPAKRHMKMTTGEYEEVLHPERFDVYLTIKGHGRQNDTGFYLDGKRELLIGSYNYFMDDQVNFEGMVMEIVE